MVAFGEENIFDGELSGYGYFRVYLHPSVIESFKIYSQYDWGFFQVKFVNRVRFFTLFASEVIGLCE